VTAMDIRTATATALAGQVGNVAAFCRERQISRQTFYKFRARFDAEGIYGLKDRSRRPVSSPGQTSAEVEELVLRRRKQLLEQGLDHGPQSIRWSLQRDGYPGLPSPSTIWRILTRHGVITPQPQKRPKSATKRFTFDRPNECWQSDWTQWSLADDSPVAIAGTLDDHSRYMPGLNAAAGAGTSELVWEVMMAAITECGIPSMSLTDNGNMYTGRLRGFEAAFETNLRALGTHTINSMPYHPQTCGKIERFWQTLKKGFAPARHRPPSRSSTPCSTSSVTSTTTTAATGHCAEPPPPRPSLLPNRPAPPTGPYRHQSSSAATSSANAPGTCSLRPTRSTSDCAGPDTTATASATASTSPSSAPSLSSVSSPLTPPANTNPATKPREPTATANPNRHHECQRCPET
jgi:transposase InsO family protein